MVLFSDNPVPFEVSYDSDSLFVALQISKWTGSAWAQEGMLIPAVNKSGTYTYGAIYTPILPNTPYLATFQAYTDDTYTTVDQNYATGSDSFMWDTTLTDAISRISGGSSGGAVINAVIDDLNQIKAVVQDQGEIL